MKTILLDDYVIGLMFMAIFWIVCFIIGVFVTRWIFGIDKILDRLQLQNEQGSIQIKLLKKLLIDRGASIEQVDEIIEKEDRSNNKDPEQPKTTESTGDYSYV